MAWTLTTPHNTARTTAAQVAANAKTLQLADAGAGPSTLRLYTDADPVTQERTHLVTIVLSKPCGTIVSGQIQLTQADPLGDMVAATGVRILGRVDFAGNRNNLYIVAIAIGAGLVPLVAPRWAQQMPHGLQILLESGILLCALVAVLLNAYFNGSKCDIEATVEASKAAGTE